MHRSILLLLLYLIIKRAAEVLAAVVAAICNASLQSGVFPESQKRALVRVRLKKPSLNPGDLNSYRPISNLTFLSKILDRVVVRQFMGHAHAHAMPMPRPDSQPIGSFIRLSQLS